MINGLCDITFCIVYKRLNKLSNQIWTRSMIYNIDMEW